MEKQAHHHREGGDILGHEEERLTAPLTSRLYPPSALL